jgi:hypothetical protein
MPAGEYTFAVNRQNRTIAIFQNDKGIGSFLLGSPNDGSNNGRTLLTFRTNNEDVYVLQKLQCCRRRTACPGEHLSADAWRYF